MHHQTLLFPSSSFSSPSFFQATSSSFALPLCPLPAHTYSHCPQVEKDSTMEALKSSLRPAALSSEKQGLGALAEEPVWVDEKGSLLGDLSVDDLLDFGDFADNDKEADEAEPAAQMEVEDIAACGGAGAAAVDMEAEKSKSDASSPSSSALSFEPPAPPPPPTLPDFSLPAHDAKEFEWVSYIVDDSCSDFPSSAGAPPASLPTPDPSQVDKRQSITASFSCSTAVQGGGAAALLGPTVCTLSTEAPVPVKAKRSKRSRTVTVGWSISGHLPFADSSSSSTTTSTASSCSTSSPLSSCLIYEHHYPSTGSGEQSLLLYESHPSLPPQQPPCASKRQHKPKKRGRKPKTQQSASASQAASAAPAAGERRCSHCGVQKTPQWRAGPLGAKTLCNACGVRFKSGRLLPEYRPACSPTFVNSIHSNSHRKVLEMRRKKEAELLAAASIPAVASF